MIQDIMAAMEVGTSGAVKLWMNWMGLIFIAALLFVRKHKAARWALLTMVATIICVSVIWFQTQNIHLFGIAHLLFWAPLALYLWNVVLSKTDNKEHKLFYVWAVLLFATIIISLIFDVRDIYLVMTGGR